MRKNIWLALLLVGCSQEEVAVVSNPAGFTVTVQDVTDKQNAILTAISGNTAAISQVKTKIESLEASLAKSEPQNGKDGDPASAPNPPAKANTALTPLKVATPGDSQSETLVELATRLYAQGVNTHMKTREELEAIDANLTASKSSPVQFHSRPTYSEPAGTVCVNGRCFVPQVSSRRRR